MSGEYRMEQKEYAYTVMEFKKIKLFKKTCRKETNWKT
jgi:hypothetical protein